MQKHRIYRLNAPVCEFVGDGDETPLVPEERAHRPAARLNDAREVEAPVVEEPLQRLVFDNRQRVSRR